MRQKSVSLLPKEGELAFTLCHRSQTNSTTDKLAKVTWQLATFDNFDTTWLRGGVGGQTSEQHAWSCMQFVKSSLTKGNPK